ncbi:hypothetical protein ES705_18530 [subsurface metagenome]
MQEPNEQTTQPKAKLEVCTIRIMFPVVSDEQAINCKKKIKEILSDIPEVNTQFSLMDMPANLPPPQR